MKSRVPALARRAAFAIAAMAAVSASACTPKAGGTCKLDTKEVCVDGKEALACHEGKWEPMTCRGPAGCAKNGNESVCDQSVAEDKDVCNLANDFVCNGDKKAMLECTGNRWVLVQTCLGDRGCMMAQKKVTCDNSVANVGDACREDDDYACSVDKKNLLVCRAGKFNVASNCKGKNACRVTSDRSAGFKVECDDSIANVGDPCDREGHYACAPDEKQIVKCVSKKFAADDKCRKNEKCAVKGDVVGCY